MAYLAGAQLVVLAAGYLIHVTLARGLGPASYGLFGIAYNALYVVVLVVTAGLPSAVTRYVAAGPERATATLATAAWLLAALAGIVTLAYVVAAGPLAALLSDSGLEPYLLASAVAIPAYSMMHIAIGYLGGRRLFSWQALLLAVYGLGKIAACLSMARLAGVTGALLALAAAPLTSGLIGLGLARRQPPTDGDGTPAVTMIAYAVPLTALAVGMQLLLTLDLFLVKAYLPDDATIGHYAAASTLARVPYAVLAAIGMVLLPSVSHSLAADSLEQVRRLITRSVQALLVFSLPAIALAVTLSEQVIVVLFSERYAPAAVPFPILVAAVCGLALFYVNANVEAACGHERRPAGIAAGAVLGGLLLGSYLVPTHGTVGAALTSLATAAAAGGVSLVLILRRFRLFPPRPVVLRAAAAGTVAVFALLLLGRGSWIIGLGVGLALAVHHLVSNNLAPVASSPLGWRHHRFLARLKGHPGLPSWVCRREE